jgi:hypothetical protein
MFRSSLFLIVGAFALTISTPAFPTTYYIDNVNGNDAWPGDLQSPGTGNGPWQTFANLAIANKLAPGDNVLLHCGGKWSQTLTLNSSGTAAAPIRIGAYPEPCADKPAIDGAKRIPAAAWTLDSGNVYKTKLPGTLIANGTLNSTVSGWQKWSSNNDAQTAIASPCPDSATACLAFTGGSVGSSLLISSPFPLEQSVRYRVTFSIRAPLGGRYGAFVRRSVSPWDALGLTASLTGTGAWQTVSLPFTATTTVDKARLDIQLNQTAMLVHVKNVSISRDESAPNALTLVTDGDSPQSVAHHPNRGYNPAVPDSLYLATASASPVVTNPDGSKGAAYLVRGSDLVLPAGVTLQPGLRVVVRSEAWVLSEHTVTSINQNQIYLNPTTTNPLQEAGWGYYLTGARWMLDSPGEWYYDAATQTLYAWPASGGAPGDTFAFSSLSLGMDINRKQNIVVEGIAIRNVRDGVYAQRSQNAALRQIEIANTARYGIDAEGMTSFELSDSNISYTGADALYSPASTGSVILDNDLAYIGVALDSAGKPANLPLPTFGAIRTGPSARISGNRLRNLSFLGIAAGSGSEVTNNAVTGHCYLLNDCAGIYFPGVNGALVTGNLVTGGVGNRLGMPSTHATSLANGLYLDLGSNNVVATDNTFAGGDFTIQSLNGYDNRLERNLLYGGRSNLVWLQESANDKRTTGNVYGNAISNNALFSTNMLPALKQSAKVENTVDFAVYQGNVYSNLLSTVMAAESSPTSSRDFQLADWQAATDAFGAPRNLDLQGRAGAPLAGFAPGLLGSTQVVNGDLSNGTTGWSSYNATLPAATIAVNSCAPLASRCLLLTAGGSTSLVSSPRFDVSRGQWYKVSFDAQVGSSGQNFRVKAIQAGPTTYNGVMDIGQLIFSGSTTLKRYAFVFQSTATAQRSSTSFGTRVDFMDVMPGQTLRVANFEIVPLTLNSGSVGHALLSNPERTTVNVSCPTEATAPAQCANYYLFPQGDQAVWPIPLAPLAAQIVFSQNAIQPDADQDGVADSQDNCPATAAGVSTNAKGCGLGQ